MNTEQTAEMPIEDPVVAEVEAAPIETSNPVEDLVKAIEAEDFNTAETQFNDLIGDRLQDTLDQAKVRIASTIFDQEESEDFEEEDDFEYEVDAELDDELAELDLEVEDEDLENAEQQ